MARTKVLLTGASGYIGGSVLSQLLATGHEGIEISALVRSENHAYELRTMGVIPIAFKGLDDLDLIKETASRHDVVISCASAMHLPSCVALVEGLGIRKAKTDSEVYYFHTSGTSNFGDHPITKAPFLGVRCDKDDIYGWEKETANEWMLRKVDVAIIDAGESLGVRTCVVNPPLIYGAGNGPFNQRSLQIPASIELSLGAKQAVVLGQGRGLWTVCHISDVARMYDVLLKKVLSKEQIFYGKDGYYFVEAGEVSWLEISQRIAEAGHAKRVFESDQVRSVTPDEMQKALGISFLDVGMVEVIWGSNSRIRGVRSREIGWTPVKNMNDFHNSVVDEFEVVATRN